MKSTGEILIALALVVTTLGSLIHDWNKTHVFNPEWTPHARFHAASGVVVNFALGLLGLGLVWRGEFDHQKMLLVCALIPLIAWGSFFCGRFGPGIQGGGSSWTDSASFWHANKYGLGRCFLSDVNRRIPIGTLSGGHQEIASPRRGRPRVRPRENVATQCLPRLLELIAKVS